MKNPESILAHYSDLLQKHGKDTKALPLDWPTEAVQERNFHAVTQLFAHERTPFTVYEVGCGLGDMADHLRRHHPLASYAGCDINPAMVENARGLRPGLALEVRDILLEPPPESDYIVASGIFNLHFGADQTQWQEHIFRMLSVMYASARKGIASNFHTSYVDWKKERDYYQDPCAVFDFAKRQLSKFVEIRHAYYPWEYALLVYREAVPFPEAAS